MNGPEHYREAERRLDQAHAAEPEFAAYLVAKAQVHATLALAAASVGQRYRDPVREEFGHSNADQAFYEVTGQ